MGRSRIGGQPPGESDVHGPALACFQVQALAVEASRQKRTSGPGRSQKRPADLVVDNRSDLVKVVAAPVVGQRTYRDARGPIYDVSAADVRQAGHVDWPGRPKKKDTQVPQSSVPSDNVADEAVYKELDDSLVRVASTASSLEAEQDSGNIIKTRYKATPNEACSQGTTSCGGPRRQETMGDTIAQTRSENVSKLSNDPLLTRGNTLQSGEDSLKLQELMALCTTLQTRVLDLETTKTTQANEIASLKRKVKKLERRNRSRTHKLKRLYNVGLTAKVESSRDEEDLEVVDAAQTITTEEITLAQALTELKSAKPKANRDKGKGIMIEEPVVEQVKPMKKLKHMRLDEELAFKLQAKEEEEEEEERLAREKAQQIKEANIAWKMFTKRAEEKRNKPSTKTQQKKTMITYLKNMEGWKHKDLKDKDFDSIKELFDKCLKRVNMFMDFRTELVEGSSKRAGIELEQEVTKKQKVDVVQEIAEVDDVQETAELDDDQEAAKIKELIEIVLDEEEVAIDVIPLAVKSPSIIDWKIHKEGKKTYYQIIRAAGSSKMCLVFSHTLKGFDKEYLETLSKLVKAKHGSTRPEEGYERDATYVHSYAGRKEISPYTCYNTDILNKKLQCDHFSEMGRIVGIKRLLDDLRFTAAQVYVTAAKLKYCHVGFRGFHGHLHGGPTIIGFYACPEEPEQAPPSPEFVLEPVYSMFMPPEDEVFLAEEQPLPTTISPTTDSPGYIADSDPEEDHEEDLEEDPDDYPADGGDNDDDDGESSDDDKDDDDDVEEDEEEEKHPTSADSVPPPVHRVTARMSVRA
ncbi:hypothetical protein Tco_1430731 [Tanacetum coccineum]